VTDSEDWTKAAGKLAADALAEDDMQTYRRVMAAGETRADREGEAIRNAREAK
jgi:hypothetical protein